MFLKLNNKQNIYSNLLWKSTWFNQTESHFKIHIYEDIFIRKYISSFFCKWSKVLTFKVIGSIYVNRTFGKLFIKVFFFYPIISSPLLTKTYKISPKINQKELFSSKLNFDVRPILKCKKHLFTFSLLYSLEHLLGVQVFFKFINICNPYSKESKFLSTVQICNLLSNKLVFFKNHFKLNIFYNSINFFVNLFKFKHPDSLLFANYLARILCLLQRHTHFLSFLKKILQNLYHIFKFRGVKILLSGNLNGFNRAQTKQIQVGSVPLQSIKTSYLVGFAESFTRLGKIGINIWIC